MQKRARSEGLHRDAGSKAYVNIIHTYVAYFIIVVSKLLQLLSTNCVIILRQSLSCCLSKQPAQPMPKAKLLVAPFLHPRDHRIGEESFLARGGVAEGGRKIPRSGPNLAILRGSVFLGGWHISVLLWGGNRKL